MIDPTQYLPVTSPETNIFQPRLGRAYFDDYDRDGETP